MTPVPPDLSDDELVALLLNCQKLLVREVPAWVTQRALDVWRPPVPVSAPAPGLLQQLVAVLRFDSWQQQGALALRTRGAASRQLLYAIGQHDIDLRVRSQSGEPARFEISGQVLGPAAQGWAEWHEHPPTQETARADVNDLGEFVLGGLHPGLGVLRLMLDGQSVELPPVELGGPARVA